MAVNELLYRHSTKSNLQGQTIYFPGFVFPNAFTPNNDGRNDSFFPIMDHGASLVTFHVYNRWGQLIYNNPVSGWSGKLENVEQPAGTYVYYAIVRKPDMNEPSGYREVSKSGAVTLLR